MELQKTNKIQSILYENRCRMSESDYELASLDEICLTQNAFFFIKNNTFLSINYFWQQYTCKYVFQ